MHENDAKMAPSDLEPVATPPPSDSANLNWRLVIRTPGLPDQTIELPDGVHSIGADHESSVHVQSDPYTSRRHAELSVGQDGVIVRDAGSRNGTLIRLRGDTTIKNGDEISVGSTTIYFERAAP